MRRYSEYTLGAKSVFLMFISNNAGSFVYKRSAAGFVGSSAELQILWYSAPADSFGEAMGITRTIHDRFDNAKLSVIRILQSSIYEEELLEKLRKLLRKLGEGL